MAQKGLMRVSGERLEYFALKAVLKCLGPLIFACVALFGCSSGAVETSTGAENRILDSMGKISWKELYRTVKDLQDMGAIAKAISNAQRRTLEGQQHNVEPEALAPVLKEFFSG